MVEADSARALAGRSDPSCTEHRGRILGVVDWKTGKTAYNQLPNKVTRKGVRQPPVSREEVEKPLTKRVGKKAIIGVDGATA